MGDQERALGYADICDRPYLHENFHATALLYRQIRFGSLPECFIALSFPFSLFYIIFPRPAPFPTRETRKYGYRCRLLAVGFSPFFAITRRMDLCSEFHLNGNNRGFPNVLRAFKERAQAAFYHFDILFFSIFIRPCDRSHRAVRLDSVFRFRKVRERLRGALISAKYANACSSFVFSPLLRYSRLGIRPQALGYPPSGSVNAAILSPRLSYLLGKYA